ncbi:DUF5615 family PIN-like protein [Thiohalocapsa sp. ML1]|uniref:DUF5615 family PIN-like protein n=1 Tax=Thiohalocapsa sp. ML1 TaxID=1431688 RepID=UPI0007323830|nr:DUF5615 family PIN-like protein [Thiohalocapsa sp. ML1]
MRLLLDESLPRRLREHLPGHRVETAATMGWSGYRNGRLLAVAAAELDALISADKNMPHQQNPATSDSRIVVADGRSEIAVVVVGKAAVR